MVSAPNMRKKSSSRGSASSQFPGKLHDLLTYTEREGLCDIISWVQNGKSIIVHNPERLLKLLPHFGFSQTKYRSFQRQLNMWHWERIIDGPFKGGWVHPYFVRGNKMLCTYMSRHGIPNPDMIQYLLSSENTSAFHTSSPFLQNSEPNVSMKSHNERIDSPPSTNPGLSNPLKMISSTYKAIDEDWDPIPVAPFVENDFNSFGGPQLSVHFVDPSSEILSLCESAQSILEPTPFRETADDTSRLFEPLSYETIYNLFRS